jgi:hypothetical protein
MSNMNNNQLVNTQSEDLEAGSYGDITKLTQDQIMELGNEPIRFKHFKHIHQMLCSLEQFQTNLSKDVYQSLNNEMEGIKGIVNKECTELRSIATGNGQQLEILHERHNIRTNETNEQVNRFVGNIQGQINQLINETVLINKKNEMKYEETQNKVQEYVDNSEGVERKIDRLKNELGTKLEQVSNESTREIKRINSYIKLDKEKLDTYSEVLNGRIDKHENQIRENQCQSDQRLTESISLWENKEIIKDQGIKDYVSNEIKKIVTKIDKEVSKINTQLSQFDSNRNDQNSQNTMTLEKLMIDNEDIKSEINYNKVNARDNVMREEQYKETIHSFKDLNLTASIKYQREGTDLNPKIDMQIDTLRKFMTDTKVEMVNAIKEIYGDIKLIKLDLERIKFEKLLNVKNLKLGFQNESKEELSDKDKNFFRNNGLHNMGRDTKDRILLLGGAKKEEINKFKIPNHLYDYDNDNHKVGVINSTKKVIQKKKK